MKRAAVRLKATPFDDEPKSGIIPVTLKAAPDPVEPSMEDILQRLNDSIKSLESLLREHRARRVE